MPADVLRQAVLFVAAASCAVVTGCASLFPESIVEQHAASLAASERSRMLRVIAGSSLFGLQLGQVYPHERFIGAEPPWQVQPGAMDFPPGDHEFRSTYPQTCLFTLRMEAGHTYQVVGRKNASRTGGRYTATEEVRDRDPAGGSTVLDVPCHFQMSEW